MSDVKEFIRPETVTEATWTLLNKIQQRQAHDATRANGFKKSLENFLQKLVKESPEKRAEYIALTVNNYGNEKDKFRFWHTFLAGSETPIAKTKTTATRFKEALEAFTAATFRDDGTISAAVTDDETGETVIFDDLPMPEPIEKSAKENELTAYLKTAELSRAEYNETLSALTKSDLENIFSLMIGLLNFVFVQLSISFPEKEMQLPKNARDFILHLIAVKPADVTEFQMLDAELMAKTGIRSKTTLIGMRNALIDWQAKAGLGLVDIQKTSGDPSASKGTRYNLLILDILATKAMSFIENGTSVADAQVAVSAITRGDEAQIKLLPESVRDAAEAIIEETVDAVESLPKVSTEVTAAAAALKETFEQKAQERAQAEETKQATRQEKLGDAFNAINDWRTAAPEEKTPELFAAYVWGMMSETRHDQTNLLTEDEAKGKLDSVIGRIEKDVILAFCLSARLPDDEAKAQINYIVKLAQNINLASKP